MPLWQDLTCVLLCAYCKSTNTEIVQKKCTDVILATCSGRRGIYDTQISADHSSRLRARVIHT